MLVSRVENEVRPRPEQVGASAITTNRAPRWPAQVGLVCQQRLMIYQLVESQGTVKVSMLVAPLGSKGVVELVEPSSTRDCDNPRKERHVWLAILDRSRL